MMTMMPLTLDRPPEGLHTMLIYTYLFSLPCSPFIYCILFSINLLNSLNGMITFLTSFLPSYFPPLIAPPLPSLFPPPFPLPPPPSLPPFPPCLACPLTTTRMIPPSVPPPAVFQPKCLHPNLSSTQTPLRRKPQLPFRRATRSWTAVQVLPMPSTTRTLQRYEYRG